MGRGGAGGVSLRNVVVSYFRILESYILSLSARRGVREVAVFGSNGRRVDAGYSRLVIWAAWKRQKALAQADSERVGIARRPMVWLKRHVNPEEMPQFRDDVLQIFPRLVRA